MPVADADSDGYTLLVIPIDGLTAALRPRSAD
jgi:hypothetical protein